MGNQAGLLWSHRIDVYREIVYETRVFMYSMIPFAVIFFPMKNGYARAISKSEIIQLIDIIEYT